MLLHSVQNWPWKNTVNWRTITLWSMLFISCGFNDSSLLLSTALFSLSGSFVVLGSDDLGLELHSWIFSLFLERSGPLACFPPPGGVLRDAQGEPGETGEPSGGAAWFHSVKTLLDINDGIVWSHNEPWIRLLSNVFGTVALVGVNSGKEGHEHALIENFSRKTPTLVLNALYECFPN